jgi:hypothetical protein
VAVLADFEITVELEPPRSVRVVVYDSEKGLRIAASRYANIGVRKRRRKRNQFAETLGICHRFEWQGSNGEHRPLCAIVRLAYPNLGVGITSHEMAHAAVWIRELNGDLDPLTCANDEPFAWLLGELVRQTINTMKEKGVYAKVDAIPDET